MNSYNGFSPAHRMRALAFYKTERAAGRKIAPTVCDGCGQTKGVIAPHSEDYSEPFGDNIGAYGLCYRCHMMIHCRFRARQAWQTYLQLLEDGAMFRPLYTPNFDAIRAMLNAPPCADPAALGVIGYGAKRTLAFLRSLPLDAFIHPNAPASANPVPET